MKASSGPINPIPEEFPGDRDYWKRLDKKRYKRKERDKSKSK